MINVKRQTKRSTRWFPKFANNINVFYRGFEFGLITTKNWGNFSQMDKNTVIFTTKINRKEYEIPLTEFKRIIQKEAKETA